MFYFALIRFDEETTGYYIKLHHLVSDGWTFYMLFEEIHRHYRELVAGGASGDGARPSYTTYIEEEKAYLSSARASEDRDFWSEYLLPLPEEVRLSWKRRPSLGIKGDVQRHTLPQELRAKILDLAEKEGTSVFKCLLAGLAVYIHKVQGLEDVVIGSASHNRNGATQKETAGMFVSTVLFRIGIRGEDRFSTLLKRIGIDVDGIVKERRRHPFDLWAVEVKEKTGIDPSYLFNINLIDHGVERAKGYVSEYHFCGNEATPLTIHLFNREILRSLELQWIYQLACFSREEIGHMHRALVAILGDALQDPGKRVRDIQLLSREERDQILCTFNDAKSACREQRTIHKWFEDQVERTPDRTALIYDEGDGNERGIRLTYRELNDRANRLARALRGKGVGPGAIVGIAAEPSHHMIIGILGTLKAGGGYLPIEPAYPQNRIRFILEDSRPHLLLTQGGLHERVPFQGERIAIDEEDFSSQDTANPGCVNTPSDLAYVIYTSGSTGKPKGVMVEHGNVSAYLEAFLAEFDLSSRDTVLQQASFSFDAFVEELYPVLLRGGRLAIPPPHVVKDMDRLADFVRKHQVTLITCSPLLLNEFNHRGDLRGVHTFISGGDVLRAEYVDRLLQHSRVYNTYGPTETTVCATYYPCAPGPAGTVPVGSPIKGYRVYVCARDGGLLPVGIPGEICVAGPGVTRGYLHRPEQTREKFTENPFRPGERLYRTGDLARWLPDGNIEFLGRLDQQVKLRGYRIEPGEIEAHLLKHGSVKGAVVTTLDQVSEEGTQSRNDDALCAYVLLRGEPPSPGDRAERVRALKAFLYDTLPEYMIPAHILFLDRIPVNPSGKVDLKALPDPRRESVEIKRGPRNRTEKRLASIWSEILGIPEDRIGCNESFFELGGHSLRAARLVARIHKEFHVKLPLEAIFTRATIEGMADAVSRAGRDSFAPINRIEGKDYYELSSAQKRMFVLQHMDEGTVGYNMPSVALMEGALDRERLEQTFHNLIARHEIFRTSFHLLDGVPFQKVHEKIDSLSRAV